MEPWEVMTSESQERMLAIVTPESWPAVAAICAKWEVRATVIGTVTEPEPDGGGRLRIRDGLDGPVLADVPAASLSDDAPLYDRPRQAPAARPRRRPPAPPDDCAADLLALLRSPALGLPPVRPPALPQHGGRAGRRRRAAAAGRARAARRPQRGVARDDRLQPAGLRARPARRHRAGPGRGRGQPGLRRRDAGRRRQLPQLRQPRAPRGDVAALGVHRRDGRGLPRPGAPGHRRQRQPLQRERRRRHRPDARARRARPRRRRATRRRRAWPGRTATPSSCSGPRRGRRRLPPGGHALGHRAPRPSERDAARRRLRRPRRGRARSWPGWSATIVGGRPSSHRAARRARRVVGRAGRGAGRNGGRRRDRLHGRPSTTPPSSSPSCRRASWWPRPCPTSCAPGRRPRASRPPCWAGPAASGSCLGDLVDLPARGPAARPTRGIWPCCWADS